MCVSEITWCWDPILSLHVANETYSQLWEAKTILQHGQKAEVLSSKLHTIC